MPSRITFIRILWLLSFKISNIISFTPNHFHLSRFITIITRSSLNYESGNNDNEKLLLREDDNEYEVASGIPKETLYSNAVINGGASVLDFEMKEHKPLGCTVEESSAPEEDGFQPVFISKVKPDGNAEKYGLTIGDVIIGISGIFDELEDTTGAGLARVRTLVSGRYPDKSLHLRVIRGTDVMARHESHLVTLCTLPGGTDDDLDDCLDSIMRDESVEDNTNEMECDEEGECMLDAMFASWGGEMTEDVPSSPLNAPQTEMEIEAKKKR